MSRPTLGPVTLINAASMTADVYGTIQLANLSMASFTISWTGSPTGTLTVEGCNDAVMQVNGTIVAGSGTWEALPFTNSSGSVVTSLSTGGTSGAGLIALSQIPTAYLRLHYNHVSGTGSLTAVAYAKVE